MCQQVTNNTNVKYTAQQKSPKNASETSETYAKININSASTRKYLGLLWRSFIFIAMGSQCRMFEQPLEVT